MVGLHFIILTLVPHRVHLLLGNGRSPSDRAALHLESPTQTFLLRILIIYNRMISHLEHLQQKHHQATALGTIGFDLCWILRPNSSPLQTTSAHPGCIALCYGRICYFKAPEHITASAWLRGHDTRRSSKLSDYLGFSSSVLPRLFRHETSF